MVAGGGGGGGGADATLDATDAGGFVPVSLPVGDPVWVTLAESVGGVLVVVTVGCTPAVLTGMVALGGGGRFTFVGGAETVGSVVVVVPVPPAVAPSLRCLAQ